MPAEKISQDAATISQTATVIIDRLTQENAALLALTEWRDISTAPRDGTPVAVWFRGRQHIAEYAPIWSADNLHWCVRDPATGESETCNLVHDIDPPMIDGKPIPGMWIGPTHWKPLGGPP